MMVRSNGRPTFPWEAKDKGGDSARPAIVEGAMYVSPRAFDLQTGKELPLRLVRGACGSYAAARNVFVCRIGDLGLWAPVGACRAAGRGFARLPAERDSGGRYDSCSGGRRRLFVRRMDRSLDRLRAKKQSAAVVTVRKYGARTCSAPGRSSPSGWTPCSHGYNEVILLGPLSIPRLSLKRPVNGGMKPHCSAGGVASPRCARYAIERGRGRRG